MNKRAQKVRVGADSLNMTNKLPRTKVGRCAYRSVCYLADQLQCNGDKADCPLYRESFEGQAGLDQFNRAMDDLIDQTLAKYQSRHTEDSD